MWWREGGSECDWKFDFDDKSFLIELYSVFLRNREGRQLELLSAESQNAQIRFDSLISLPDNELDPLMKYFDERVTLEKSNLWRSPSS
jgi:hypothetical protein